MLFAYNVLSKDSFFVRRRCAHSGKIMCLVIKKVRHLFSTVRHIIGWQCASRTTYAQLKTGIGIRA